VLEDMRIVSIVLAATVSFACGKHEQAAPPPPPPPPKQPVRGAVADRELRVMLAEVASAQACEMMRGTLRGLRAADQPELTTGILWTRDCKIDSDGTKVVFHLGGLGWQWADRSEHKAGARFELHDYVKFGVQATIPGTLDIAYDTHDHVVSLWFSPTRAPAIQFTPVGKVDVDEKGAWSSMLGALSSVFGSSPDEQGTAKAKQQGTQQFETQLGQGMTVAIDLCTGYRRFTIGRPPKGDLGPPDPGESRTQPVQIQPGGLMAFGPFEAPDGMHVALRTDGPVRAGLACADDAYPAVEAFVRGTPAPLVKTLAQRDVNGNGSLAVGGQRCRIALVVRSLATSEVTFDWQRPPREIAQSTGGAAIHCERKQTVSSDRDGSDRPVGRAAARRR
jgi:hypothetical protein